MNPTTCETAYFGGIEIIMWTWSGMRCPSSILLSFCTASLRNTSPRCFLNSPYRVLLRHLGMNTTWYLHSHLVWLRLSYSSIVELSSRVRGGSRVASFVDGRLPQMSNFYCHPGRAGGPLLVG